MTSQNQANVDFDALLDFSEIDNAASNFEPPALSPSASSKATFASPVSAAETPLGVSSSSRSPPVLCGPSHNYDLYRQQTGFVPGAIANTMAVNQTNNTGYQHFASLDFTPGIPSDTEAFNFGTSPTQSSMSMDLDLEQSIESQPLFNTVNPSRIEEHAPGPSVLSQPGSVGRLWPGAHSQAALAKAQTEERRRQQQQQQQQPLQHQPPNLQPQQRQPSRPVHRPQKSRGKIPQPSDPFAEQKITELLNKMRAKPSTSDAQGQSPGNNLSRFRKDEEDMDEDERLLASEEGKKLSSKERRQLRNKVSARAFRSRRKEYITQLEAEIAGKVSENGELRAHNNALVAENKQLSDLTRMLLSSPCFSSLLDDLSTNPTSMPQVAPEPTQIKMEPQQATQDMSHVNKDVNPHGGPSSQQQIGMAMIPEPSMNYTFNLSNPAAYNYQPQVFVVDTPEVAPVIDASVLAGKSRDVAEDSLFCNSGDVKTDMPILERLVKGAAPPAEPVDESTVDEDFESDSEFCLFHARSASAPSLRSTSAPESSETFSSAEAHESYCHGAELAQRHEDMSSAEEAMARVWRISAAAEAVVTRLELLTAEGGAT